MTQAQIEEGNFGIPQLNNLRIIEEEEFDSPDEVHVALPVTRKAADTVVASRQEIQNVLHGRDKRLMVIVGPCSIHDPKSALEYAERLSYVRTQFADKLLIVMRVYFEKPRSTIGWTGLINTPSLTGRADVNLGRRIARKLMLDINELSVPVATEMLDPLNPPYLSDLISWGAIGARTTESQNHRHMASGLSFPVGFKNGTGGNGDIAIDAMVTAREPHSYQGLTQTNRGAVLHSTGNPDVQLILRGGADGPNYDVDTVTRAMEILRSKQLPPRVIVDCSHANADKDFRKQLTVLDYVLKQRKKSAGYPVSGVMIESNLKEGKQALADLHELEYGVSITDGCIGWEETEVLLADAYRRA